MSKFKVPLINFMRECYIIHKNKRQFLYIFPFLKTIRQYSPFQEGHTNDKIIKYWMRHSIPDTMALADRLFAQERYIEVYELLNRICFGREFEVLWRIARALYNLSFDRAITDGIREQMIEEAYHLLDIALSTEENSAEVHKWMAIIMDAKYGLVNLETRVRHSPIVREHLVKACILNPHDFTSQYMLGKWCFEMSELNWFQRAIAKYFIAWEPPKSSYEEAYKYLSRAEELQPRTFLPNIYLLGKTCIKMGQFYKAKYYLNLTVNLPPRDDCEKCCITKAKYLIKKLDRYELGKSVLFYDSYPFGFTN